MADTKLTASDYKMTRATALKILRSLPKEHRELCVFHQAIIRFKSGRRLRYCLVFDGMTFRSSKEWAAFQTPSGFTRASLRRLHQLTAEG